LHTSDDRRGLQIASAAPGIHDPVLESGELHFNAEQEAVGRLSLALAAAGVQIYSLQGELATLEELFFRLTEGDAEGAEHEPERAEGEPERAEGEAEGAEGEPDRAENEPEGELSGV
jgi:hypothetical protein